MITVGELFDICADIELRNAKMYADFMFRFGGDDDRIVQLWEEMSGEEWEHYVIVNFGKKLAERAKMLHEVVQNFRESIITDVSKILADNENRAAEGDYSLNDAFEMAINFETSEADAIFIRLVATIRRAIDRLGEHHLLRRIEKMEGKVHEHHDRLIKAIARLANSPELVRRARDVLHVHV